MVSLSFLQRLENALRKIYPAKNSVERIFVSYLDYIPKQILESSIKTHNTSFVITITGVSLSNSLFTINTHSDVIELDAVFSCVSMQYRGAYNDLLDLFKKFGFGETPMGTLYRKAFKPFLLHPNEDVMIHDCNFYGGNFKPLVEQLEVGWLVGHETSVVLSIAD